MMALYLVRKPARRANTKYEFQLDYDHGPFLLGGQAAGALCRPPLSNTEFKKEYNRAFSLVCFHGVHWKNFPSRLLEAVSTRSQVVLSAWRNITRAHNFGRDGHSPL
jgi:hypothetical protein